MITTGDHDDRVVPLHSHKLTATLQHVLAGEPGSLVPGGVAWLAGNACKARGWHRRRRAPINIDISRRP